MKCRVNSTEAGSMGLMDKHTWSPAPLSLFPCPTLTPICVLCSDLRHRQWWESLRRFNPRTPRITEVRHCLNNVTWKIGLCSLCGNAQMPPLNVKGSRNPFHLGLFLLSSSQGSSLMKICMLSVCCRLPLYIQRRVHPPPRKRWTFLQIVAHLLVYDMEQCKLGWKCDCPWIWLPQDEGQADPWVYRPTLQNYSPAQD